jgi:5-methyltetrahydrofolate--homocysteine methyltransferase
MLDSTEPNVLKAGLESLGGRSVINSVNFEDGDGENSRFARIMPLVKEHGAAVVALTIDEEGQARTAEWKLRVAERLVSDLTNKWQMQVEDIMIDCLTFPIATGQEETRGDGKETLNAIAELKKKYPTIQTTLGVSNISFGLKPAARVVLNSVFLSEAVKNGLDSAIIHPSKIKPIVKIPEEQVKAALDLIYDAREYDSNGNVIFDPLTNFLNLFENIELVDSNEERLAALAALPIRERLERRIIDGEKIGLEVDLQRALDENLNALEIINDVLLSGMKTVGELFGSGQMQLPFVLQSAEVMKTAVAFLEPFIEKTESTSEKGSILLATVKGDVHDIGKNLVDIILSNNGYRTVNIGIKQTINQIIDAATENNVDVIGMSGLLVKSTVIMKENLEELMSRKLDKRWPVILGGAALTRTYVEQDLAQLFTGTVRYAKDAFEGLSLMDTLMSIKRGEEGAALPPLRERKTPVKTTSESRVISKERSNVKILDQVPTAPFFGSKIIKGIQMQDYVGMLDERALFMGQWGLKGRGESFQEIVENEGRPRLRSILNEAATQSWFTASVVYGYFPCYSEENDLVILHHEGPNQGRERMRFTFPRQSRDRRLCLSDFFQPKDSGKLDVVSFHIVTMGESVSAATAKLFSEDRYREYLELHGLSVQLTEALAEHWHARIRDELGVSGEDSSNIEELIDQGYRGSRYSFGYPACPDLSQQLQLCDLLEPERIGVLLSDEFQLHPEQSTSAMIVHHPEAKYFNAN